MAWQEPSALETARHAVAEGDTDHDGALDKLEFVSEAGHDKVEAAPPHSTWVLRARESSLHLHAYLRR